MRKMFSDQGTWFNVSTFHIRDYLKFHEIFSSKQSTYVRTYRVDIRNHFEIVGYMKCTKMIPKFQSKCQAMLKPLFGQVWTIQKNKRVKIRMTTSTQSQSKKLGEEKVIASQVKNEKLNDQGILSVNLTWKEHFFNAMCPIASKI